MIDYEVLIGLEIHAELNTQSKVFCACKNEYGASPNTLICPTCLGLAGSTPYLNKSAVELAVMAGLALGCDINEYSIFERRNYFYPNLPKSYQITQYSHPLCNGGGIRLDSGKFVPISRMHLEEDNGKMISTMGDYDYIDFNRSGVPLVEIVTPPALNNADEVIEFVQKLRDRLVFAGVSDCRMEEGGLRMDVNISVKSSDIDELGERVELKNLSSFKTLAKCIDYEISRQTNELKNGGVIKRETRVWDDGFNRTYAIRDKEQSKDYRYFPDPDLNPLRVTSKDVERIRNSMPEDKTSRINKYLSLGLSVQAVNILTLNKDISDYYDNLTILTGEPIECANWMMNNILHVYKEEQRHLPVSHIISEENLAYIINLVLTGKITRQNANFLFDEVVLSGKPTNVVVKELGLLSVVEDDDIKDIINSELVTHPEIVNDFKINTDAILNYLLGKVMYATHGKAMPDRAREITLNIINKKLN